MIPWQTDQQVSLHFSMPPSHLMSSSNTTSIQHKVKTTPTFVDWIFILIVLSVLASVALLGHDAYLEAMKTEVTKKNGEDLAAWLTKASAQRFKHPTTLTECMGGKPPLAELTEPATEVTSMQSSESTVSVTQETAPVITKDIIDVGDEQMASTIESKPGTWGACFEYLMNKSELKDMLNPFTNEAPQFVAACIPSDPNLPGAILIEKLTPTPPGSAVPVINSQLINSDPIDQKLQLRISVCDKGSYAIKIAEFEF
jgi:hypothetical protein